MSISYTSVDNHLWLIQRYLMVKHGCDAGERMMYPLRWYINTGRASVAFLHALLAAKPFMVGRVLSVGGSDDAVIDRIKTYLSLNDAA